MGRSTALLRKVTESEHLEPVDHAHTAPHIPLARVGVLPEPNKWRYVGTGDKECVFAVRRCAMM